MDETGYLTKQQSEVLIALGREAKKRAEAVRVAFEGAEKALGQGEVWKAKSYVEELRELAGDHPRLGELEARIKKLEKEEEAHRRERLARAVNEALAGAEEALNRGELWKAKGHVEELRELDAGEVRIEGLERELGEVVRAVGRRFRECEGCPWMVVVPPGEFMMGSPESEAGRDSDEGPVHRVRIERPFAVGVYELTFAEWDACVSGGGCGGYRPSDAGWGRGNRPVIRVSWEDAKAYVRWLSEETGEEYRLLSESEWEYVARAGTRTPFHTGQTISTGQANYDGRYTYGSGRKGRYRGETVEVGSFEANGYGLHDVHGNVWEWVEDCWNGGYREAPADGSAWETGDCSRRVLRGGSWVDIPWLLRSADRYGLGTGNRSNSIGFRIARTLTP